jgi:hypothetical protein
MNAIPFALDTNDAKTIGTIVIVVFIALGVLSAWLMKTIVQKVVLVVVLGGLAVFVYSQRTSLDQCVDDITVAISDADRQSATCSFVGFEVELPVTIDN